MRETIRKWIQRICELLELLVAVLVLIGIVDALVGYFLGFTGIYHRIVGTGQFLTFLENMFNVVVGIEFVKMLLKPNGENVIEVLVFLIGRHMIIGDNSAVDILLSVISVGVLYGLRWFLRTVDTEEIESQSHTWTGLLTKFRKKPEEDDREAG